MKRILLLRHGSTEANERFLYCGRSDISLTDKGKNYLQSRALSYQKKLNSDEKENSVNVKYFTSGMKRTDETLEILFDTRSYERLTDFKEMDFGIYEMKSYDELKDRPDYREWISGDFYSNIPGYYSHTIHFIIFAHGVLKSRTSTAVYKHAYENSVKREKTASLFSASSIKRR